jgi:signal transduction histidine kinase
MVLAGDDCGWSRADACAMITSMGWAGERIARRDIAIAAVVSALGVALMAIGVNELSDGLGPDEGAEYHVGSLLPHGFAIPLFLLVTVPLLWRRVAPQAAVGAAVAGLVLNEALLGTEFIRCGIVGPMALLFAFTAGAQPTGRAERQVLIAAMALLVFDFIPELGPVAAAVAAALTVGAWGIGRVVASRRRLADELAATTEELRDARDERARLEVGTERARVSAELDALLQRRLGQLAAMAERGADAPDAGALLAAIETASRDTLAQMRALVGVLRDDGEQSPTSPQPTLTHLETLLARVGGPDARLTVQGSPRTLPPAVELSAFRVLEHLLAALEAAPGVSVEVCFGDDALTLAVSGPARRDASTAIGRARERARLHDGTLEATVERGRARALASLPVHATV